MNLQTIAEEFGVSSATVSNALSGKGRVSAELAQRIRERAQEMGYAPSPPARALRTGRTGVIGLVLADLSNPLFPRFARAVDAAAERAGYGVLIADSHGDVNAQTAALQRLVRRGADGIVVVPRRGTRVLELDVPLAVIDAPSTPGNTVCADHRGGGAALASRMLALGHRRLALIGANRDSNVQRERIGGISAALVAAGAEGRVVWLEDAPAPDFSALARAGVTAFLATSDLHALTVLTALQRAGLAVPGRASVAGFDDLAFSAAVSPSLTTMAQDVDAVAEGAVVALAARIADRAPPPEATVPMTLVERESTGPAPGAPPTTVLGQGDIR
ncbi:LacI family DNA-binding transcriptional regulator [uncultured Albimonas sp.]|uniref:LacI family DNA-binding transcriptional regulator n=1 Tax=uncultured Albimonas sp. TaxID=1331701 RepID=UPI0030EC4078|tara:strand:- start:2016 stop:3008 length:993 start_codon:yes stop_codon:yes gene_type:complete